MAQNLLLMVLAELIERLEVIWGENQALGRGLQRGLHELSLALLGHDGK